MLFYNSSTMMFHPSAPVDLVPIVTVFTHKIRLPHQLCL
jgi:hypothetical protein